MSAIEIGYILHLEQTALSSLKMLENPAKLKEKETIYNFDKALAFESFLEIYLSCTDVIDTFRFGYICLVFFR